MVTDHVEAAILSVASIIVIALIIAGSIWVSGAKERDAKERETRYRSCISEGIAVETCFCIKEPWLKDCRNDHPW